MNFQQVDQNIRLLQLMALVDWFVSVFVPVPGVQVVGSREVDGYCYPKTGHLDSCVWSHLNFKLKREKGRVLVVGEGNVLFDPLLL